MNDKLQTKRTIGIPALHKRIAAPNVSAQPDAMPNRIVLMLDCSGSMSSGTLSNNVRKIDQLKDAMQGFVTSCNFTDTALAIECFPSGEQEDEDGYSTSQRHSNSRVALTTMQPLILSSVIALRSGGGTPMAGALRFAIEHYSLTRGVLVSDGDADNAQAAIDAAGSFAEAEIPIDCVHIGDSTHGESTLKEIAQRTGGLFLKFTDVGNFAKNFKYLTPGFYGQLTSGAISAAALGAEEIKK